MITSENYEAIFDTQYLAASLLEAVAANDAEQATLILNEVETIPGGQLRLLSVMGDIVWRALATEPVPPEAFTAAYRASVDRSRQIIDNQKD